jgi:hypothetical protein
MLLGRHNVEKHIIGSELIADEVVRLSRLLGKSVGINDLGCDSIPMSPVPGATFEKPARI